MVLVAGEDRDIRRLDDWTVCFAGAIDPVCESFEHSGPLVIFLPLEVLIDEPISKRFRIIRRGCGRHRQRH